MNLKNVVWRALPTRFDTNEWYTIVIFLIVFSLIVFLHRQYRRLGVVEAIFIFLLNNFIASFIDHYLTIPPLDMYDTADRPYHDIVDVLLQVFVYPGFMYLLMYCYIWLEPKGVRRIWFTLTCSLITALLDWISVRYFHLFVYKTWNIVLSFLFYIFVIEVNIEALCRIRRLLHKN